jgi:hypothetical protein
VPDIELTQTEADSLIALEKIRANDSISDYPGIGGSVTVPLTSRDKREHFLLDISRGRIDLLRGKYQNRGRQTVVLVRLDFGGSPHRNPDGEEIRCPHLHIYREGYGDKWAVPVPMDCFSNMDDLWQTLSDFMDYCQIVEPPHIDRGLFA